MFLLILSFLLQDLVADTPLTCSNQTITLGKTTSKNSNPSWLLPAGSYMGRQNCLYQINVPKFYSAEITVEFSGFNLPNLLSISDTYGGVISSGAAWTNGSFSLEFPYPSVSIAIITEAEGSTEPPTIANLMVRSIEHKPFDPALLAPLSGPSNASFRLVPVDPIIEPTVIFLGDCTADTSLMFKSNNDPNITLHTALYSTFEVKLQLVNIHIYTYDEFNPNNFYAIGTLFAPQVLSVVRRQAICLFISKVVTQEILLVVTSDQNTNYYKKWEFSYTLSPERAIYLGPEFCLDASEGPAAHTIYANLSVFDRFHKTDGLTNLMVTSINSTSSTIPPVKLFYSFPRDPVLTQPVYIFSGDPNELPQKTFRNVNTFMIESGSVCITTKCTAIEGGWNIAYPKRRGIVNVYAPVVRGSWNPSKEFHFYSQDEATNYRWNFSMNLAKSAVEGTRCDMKYTYNKQTTSTQLLLNSSNPSALTSLSFTAERVDAVMTPASGGEIWIDYLIEESFSARREHLLLLPHFGGDHISGRGFCLSVDLFIAIIDRYLLQRYSVHKCWKE